MGRGFESWRAHSDRSRTLDGETTLTELLEDHGSGFRDVGVTTLPGLVLAETGTLAKGW